MTSHLDDSTYIGILEVTEYNEAEFMKKILIAEDDKILAKRLCRALEKHGDTLDVIAVSNGREAMEVLGEHQISLLVTDIQMPEVDGFGLLAHVSENYPVIPCFVMTIVKMPEIKLKLPEDLVRFFPKPFEMEDFVTAVVETVSRDIPRGVLCGISVASLCAMIEMEKKTCLFEVIPPEEERGILYFDRGILYDASISGLKGEAAALQILGHEKATFKFKHFPDKKISRKINKNLWMLIEEAVASKANFDEIDWGEVIDDSDAGA
jgi:CheY-like chemotaxis protein